VKEAKSAEEAVTSEFRKKEEVLELKLQTIQHKAYSLGQSSQQLKHHQR
jgi:chaperonin cofactor prefoldin